MGVRKDGALLPKFSSSRWWEMDSPDFGGKIEYDAQIDRPDNEGKPGARGGRKDRKG